LAVAHPGATSYGSLVDGVRHVAYRTKRAVAVGILALLGISLVAPPAQAAQVSIVDFGFDPAAVRIGQGESVIWTNTGSVDHTSTQDEPLAFWDTRRIAPGDFGEVDQGVLVAAGSYPYHCTIHPSMHGVVRVALRVNRTTGTTATTFTFTLASAAQPGFVYDVQRKRGSGQWRAYATGLSSTTTTFRASVPGTYSFRSRLHRTSDDATSGWSRPRALTVS
jgi:plastocyanin